jgi:hypothetical protein
MKFGILILAGFLIFQAECFAQKKPRGHKLDQPHSAGKQKKLGFIGDNPNSKGKKSYRLSSGNDKPSGKGKHANKAKIGYVGDNPSVKTKKVRYMKPEPGKSTRKRSIVAENKINKPKRKPNFIAAEKSPQNRNLRIPKQVNDKEMVLPKMKGDKKPKKTKYEIQGADPGVNVESHKEKRVSDIQYRSSYKFDKQGTSKKRLSKKSKSD